MKYNVLWYHAAVEDLQHLTVRNQRQATRIALAVRELGNTGRGDLKKLSGRGDWRLRVGDWRIFLEYVGADIHVTGISDRQDAYN